MKLGSRRVIIPTLLVIAAGFYLLTRGGGVPVETSAVARDTLSVTVGVEGRTRAVELFTVTAPVSGRLTRIDLDEGAQVDEGALIARILPAREDPRTALGLQAEVDAARAARVEAESGVEQARARAEQTRREAERRAALDAGTLSAEAVEQAQVNARLAARALESAEAARDASAARLAAARARLLGTSGEGTEVPAIEVTAPVGGRVLRVPDASERVVAAGAPLVELADVRGLEVVFDVLSEDAVRVEPGQPIRITEWGGEPALTGRVRTVTLSGYTKVSALGVEEQRVDVIGDLDHVPAELGSGYRVAGDIVVWRGEDVLTVPTSGVFRWEDGWAVYVVERGRAVLTEVALGRRNPDRAVVLEGLAEGDAIVIFPPASLEDGARVAADRGGPEERRDRPGRVVQRPFTGKCSNILATASST